MPDKDFLQSHLRDLPYFRAFLRAVESHFYQDVELTAPTLDVGCGDGNFAELTFERKLEVGVDPWWPPIREAVTRDTYDLLTQADGAYLPYPDAYFGSAISNSVLEHIPHIDAVLVETRRVLRPGAIFAFCVPNDLFNPNLSIARAFDKLKMPLLAQAYRNYFTKIARHVHLDGAQVWEKRLNTAGFVVEKHWNYFPPRSLAILEWGHYFGLPSLIIRKLFGRWILVRAGWNLNWLARLLRPHAEPVACDDGVCTFYIARRK
jgi:SAM-dependent methyltransferase